MAINIKFHLAILLLTLISLSVFCFNNINAQSEIGHARRLNFILSDVNNLETKILFEATAYAKTGGIDASAEDQLLPDDIFYIQLNRTQLPGKFTPQTIHMTCHDQFSGIRLFQITKPIEILPNTTINNMVDIYRSTIDWEVIPPSNEVQALECYGEIDILQDTCCRNNFDNGISCCGTKTCCSDPVEFSAGYQYSHDDSSYIPSFVITAQEDVRLTQSLLHDINDLDFVVQCHDDDDNKNKNNNIQEVNNNNDNNDINFDQKCKTNSFRVQLRNLTSAASQLEFRLSGVGGIWRYTNAAKWAICSVNLEVFPVEVKVFDDTLLFEIQYQFEQYWSYSIVCQDSYIAFQNQTYLPSPSDETYLVISARQDDRAIPRSMIKKILIIPPQLYTDLLGYISPISSLHSTGTQVQLELNFNLQTINSKNDSLQILIHGTHFSIFQLLVEHTYGFQWYLKHQQQGLDGTFAPLNLDEITDGFYTTKGLKKITLTMIFVPPFGGSVNDFDNQDIYRNYTNIIDDAQLVFILNRDCTNVIPDHHEKACTLSSLSAANFLVYPPMSKDYHIHYWVPKIQFEPYYHWVPNNNINTKPITTTQTTTILSNTNNDLSQYSRRLQLYLENQEEHNQKQPQKQQQQQQEGKQQRHFKSSRMSSSSSSSSSSSLNNNTKTNNNNNNILDYFSKHTTLLTPQPLTTSTPLKSVIFDTDYHKNQQFTTTSSEDFFQQISNNNNNNNNQKAQEQQQEEEKQNLSTTIKLFPTTTSEFQSLHTLDFNNINNNINTKPIAQSITMSTLSSSEIISKSSSDAPIGKLEPDGTYKYNITHDITSYIFSFQLHHISMNSNFLRIWVDSLYVTFDPRPKYCDIWRETPLKNNDEADKQPFHQIASITIIDQLSSTLLYMDGFKLTKGHTYTISCINTYLTYFQPNFKNFNGIPPKELNIPLLIGLLTILTTDDVGMYYTSGSTLHLRSPEHKIIQKLSNAAIFGIVFSCILFCIILIMICIEIYMRKRYGIYFIKQTIFWLQDHLCCCIPICKRNDRLNNNNNNNIDGSGGISNIYFITSYLCCCCYETKYRMRLNDSTTTASILPGSPLSSNNTNMDGNMSSGSSTGNRSRSSSNARGGKNLGVVMDGQQQQQDEYSYYDQPGGLLRVNSNLNGGGSKRFGGSSASGGEDGVEEIDLVTCYSNLHELNTKDNNNNNNNNGGGMISIAANPSSRVNNSTDSNNNNNIINATHTPLPALSPRGQFTNNNSNNTSNSLFVHGNNSNNNTDDNNVTSDVVIFDQNNTNDNTNDNDYIDFSHQQQQQDE